MDFEAGDSGNFGWVEGEVGVDGCGYGCSWGAEIVGGGAALWGGGGGEASFLGGLRGSDAFDKEVAELEGSGGFAGAGVAGEYYQRHGGDTGLSPLRGLRGD